MATPAIDRLHATHVFWLLSAFAMVAVPHVERLPLWITLLCAALIAWRIHLVLRDARMPSKWLLLIFALCVVGGVYISYGRVFGRDSGIAMLVVMLALKLLEMNRLRDAMVMVFLCYFLVITNFLYSQSIATALYMLLVVWVITATMIGFQFRRAQPGYRYQLRGAGILLLQAVPLMVVLFVLFPRVQGPLWGLPQDANAAVTGLSDEMSPGSVSQLLLSDAIAFRVSFASNIPPLNRLYWRGPVMWDFDGRTWSTTRIQYFGTREFQKFGSPIDYTITVEPHSRRWLFALDLPAQTPPRALTTTDFQIQSPTPVNARIRYDMSSYIDYRDNAEPGRFEMRRALALPAEGNARARQLATNMRRAAASESEYIGAVLAMFRDQNFYYTTTPPLLKLDPVDEFLFATRAGFCEHYASAFAFLMRAAGIPARIVTGYQGGELNLVGNYMTVRQADAHAWVEVWRENLGWTRIDPTAAVSPARVEAGVAAAVPQAESLPLVLRGEYAWLRRARMTLDSVANAWNQSVLGYTQDRQRQLMRSVGIDHATWRSMVVAMMVATGLITLALAIGMLRKLRTARADPAYTAYARFCERLARRGLRRHLSEGPDTFCKRAATARPEMAHAIEEITALYVLLRYGRDPAAADMLRLQRSVAAFDP